MELNHYFDPVDFGRFRGESKFSRHTLGYYIERDTLKGAASGKGAVRVALVGVPHAGTGNPAGWAKAPEAMRRKLYGMSHFGESTGVVDLGDLRPGKGPRDLYFALRDVTDYLTGEGITLVIMGGSQEWSIGICRAFTERDDFVLSVIDARVDLKSGREVTGATNFLTKVVNENPRLFHLQMIGTQAPLVPPAVTDFLYEQTFDLLSLGQLRDDIQQAEPLLRHTTFLSFDMGAIKGSEVGHSAGISPNGLYSEEACRLSRYAGLSPTMEVFALSGSDPDHDPSEVGQSLAAQILWYFLEARTQCRREDPRKETSPFVRYYVEMEIHGEPVVFYHHPPTNRWWLEVFHGETGSWIIPCQENDYSSAVRQELPEIWWKFARKLSVYQNNRKLNSFFAKR